MYRALLYFAFFAICSAAPYGDLTATRTIVPPPQPEQPYAKSVMPVFSQRRDETDLVDTTASGYSFFRHQPIGLRPVGEQRVAISEPFLRTDDSSNQYGNYAKSSAFKTLPAQNEYAAALARTMMAPEQGPYGSALSRSQPDTRVLLQQGYGQEKLAPPTIRVVSNAYGQPQVEEKTFISVKSNNGYGSQVQPDNRVLLQQGYGQEKLVPPSVRVVTTGYGQPQVEEKRFISVKSNNGYGSQVQPDNRVLHQQGYGQNKVLVSNDYGSQVRPDNRVLLQQGYGQEKLVPSTIRVVSNGYGQPQVEEKTFISVKSNNGYGSQVVPDNRVLLREGYGQQRLINPMVKTLNSGYGQQGN